MEVYNNDTKVSLHQYKEIIKIEQLINRMLCIQGIIADPIFGLYIPIGDQV